MTVTKPMVWFFGGILCAGIWTGILGHGGEPACIFFAGCVAAVCSAIGESDRKDRGW